MAAHNKSRTRSVGGRTNLVSALQRSRKTSVQAAVSAAAEEVKVGRRADGLGFQAGARAVRGAGLPSSNCRIKSLGRPCLIPVYVGMQLASPPVV